MRFIFKSGRPGALGQKHQVLTAGGNKVHREAGTGSRAVESHGSHGSHGPHGGVTASILEASGHWLVRLEVICHTGKKLLFNAATAFLISRLPSFEIKFCLRYVGVEAR